MHTENQASGEQLLTVRDRRGTKRTAQEVQALREEVRELRTSQKETEEKCGQIIRKNAALQERLSKLEAIVWAAIPPFHFTLRNYSHYKKHSLKWCSPPFHSHPRGYRLAVEVDAYGSSVGQGSYVSVYVQILRGENDEKLQWPFRGSVSIKLLNGRRDGGHFEKTIEFTDDTPLVNSGRVGMEGERTQAWGDPLFIAHSELTHNPVSDSEYMMFDRLCFIVSEVCV